MLLGVPIDIATQKGDEIPLQRKQFQVLQRHSKRRPIDVTGEGYIGQGKLLKIGI